MTSIRHTPLAAAPTPQDDAYLDAARASILAVGWSRATLTDVARRAGVSRMTLYRRWPDTRTLLADLMTREWAQVTRVAVESSAADPDPVSGITASVLAAVQALRTDPLMLRIVEVDPEVLLPYLLQRRGRMQDSLVQVLAELVGTAQAVGAVRPGDPHVMARALVLTCHGFTLSALTMTDEEPDGVGLDQLDAELAHLLQSHLRP